MEEIHQDDSLVTEFVSHGVGQGESRVLVDAAGSVGLAHPCHFSQTYKGKERSLISVMTFRKGSDPIPRVLQGSLTLVQMLYLLGIRIVRLGHADNRLN